MRTSLRAAFALALALGSVVGLTVSFWPGAEASRNAAGTYSLPLSSVVAGNTITSTWANTTLSDLATEITNSLDRGGRGAMTAPLQLSNGTVSLPSLTFGSDTDSGLYRIGANNIGIAVNGAKVGDVGTTGIAVTGLLSATTTLAVTGASTLTGAVGAAAGITATQSTANAVGVTSTGNGSGAGVSGTGGTTGAGGTFSGGATSGTGITATGGPLGSQGVAGTGGAGSGNGGLFTGGPTDGRGIYATGDGTGVGGEFLNGTDATGGTRQDAVKLANGDLDLSAVANPTSTTSISERLTPMNLPKAWASFTGTGSSGAQTIHGGFNITSVTADTAGGGWGEFTVTIAADMADTNYAVITSNNGSTAGSYVYGQAAGTFNVAIRNNSGGSISLASLSSQRVDVVVFGAQ